MKPELRKQMLSNIVLLLACLLFEQAELAVACNGTNVHKFVTWEPLNQRPLRQFKHPLPPFPGGISRLVVVLSLGIEVE